MAPDTTYEDGNELKAVPRAAVVEYRVPVFQQESDFDDPCDTGSHQCEPKCHVRRRTDHQLLRMCGHRPSSHEQNCSRNEVSLWSSVTTPAQPHANKASTQPDDTDHGMLPIVANPISAPMMLGETIDETPKSEDGAIVEFLGSAASSHPKLTDEENDCQNNTVGNKSASHDEVRCALPEVVALTEAQCRDASKHQLCP
jgi:hypothetical protein